MKKTTPHTPAPWNIVPTVHSGRLNIFGVSPTQEYYIGTLVGGSKKDLQLLRANAAFIIKACNSHQDLAQALEMVLDADGDLDAIDFNQIRAALAEANQDYPLDQHLAARLDEDERTGDRGGR